MSCDCYNKYINDLAEQKRVANNNRWKLYANEMEMWRQMNRKPKPLPDAYWCDICIAPLLDEEFELQMKQDKVRNIFLKRLHDNDAEAIAIMNCRRIKEIIYVDRKDFPTLFDELFEIIPNSGTRGSYDSGNWNEYMVSEVLSNTADDILSFETT